MRDYFDSTYDLIDLCRDCVSKTQKKNVLTKVKCVESIEGFCTLTPADQSILRAAFVNK